jgi:hypothetical protein
LRLLWPHERRDFHVSTSLTFVRRGERDFADAAGVHVAGTSSSPSALLLALIGLVPPIVMPLWLGAPAIAPAGTERRS